VRPVTGVWLGSDYPDVAAVERFVAKNLKIESVGNFFQKRAGFSAAFFLVGNMLPALCLCFILALGEFSINGFLGLARFIGRQRFSIFFGLAVIANPVDIENIESFGTRGFDSAAGIEDAVRSLFNHCVLLGAPVILGVDNGQFANDLAWIGVRCQEKR
jgi:hypothetical protein